MSETVISIKDLSKSFGDHEVLRKIDIDVHSGEVICIVGSSGSGNQHCLGASTSLKNRPQERFYITIKRSEMYKRISMITVQRWEWCSSPSICSTI